MGRLGFAAGIALSALLADGLVPAHASDAPVFVIPGRADVPVIINGFDASYRVVEGDWGLDRPGAMTPQVGGPLFVPRPYDATRYFPWTGRQPAYGRREVTPSANRRLPPPAESFYRVWGAASDPLPADIAPAEPPHIVVEPQVDGRPPQNDPRQRRLREPRDRRAGHAMLLREPQDHRR